VLHQYKIVNNLTKEVVLKGGKDYMKKEDFSTALTFQTTSDYWKNFLTKYTLDGPEINSTVAKSFLGKLDEMIDFFENYNKYEFRSMSLFTAVDHSQDLYVIKLIDIAYITDLEPGEERDEGVLLGLKSIKAIIEKVMERDV
jgi:hypothetical protein